MCSQVDVGIHVSHLVPIDVDQVRHVPVDCTSELYILRQVMSDCSPEEEMASIWLTERLDNWT